MYNPSYHIIVINQCPQQTASQAEKLVPSFILKVLQNLLHVHAHSHKKIKLLHAKNDSTLSKGIETIVQG